MMTEFGQLESQKISGFALSNIFCLFVFSGFFLQWNKHCTIDLTSSYYTTNKRCKSVICNTNLDFVVVYNASSIAMVIEQMICIILDSSFLFYYYYYYYIYLFFFCNIHVD